MWVSRPALPSRGDAIQVRAADHRADHRDDDERHRVALLRPNRVEEQCGKSVQHREAGRRGHRDERELAARGPRAAVGRRGSR